MFPFLLNSPVWQSVVVALVLCLMAGDTPQLLRLKRYTSSAARLSTYRSSVAGLWAAALCTLALTGPGRFLTVPQAADATPDWFGHPIVGTLASILLALFFALAFAPALHCALRSGVRRKYCGAMRQLHFILPVGAGERRWWVLLSISAGVCEEVFFRGLLPQFLHGQTHGGWQLNPGAAWTLAALLFGCCHAYQGVGGVIRTALAGVMFSLLAILSGGLLLPIVLHALLDMTALWMYHPQQDYPAAAAQLQHGSAGCAVFELDQPKI